MNYGIFFDFFNNFINKSLIFSKLSQIADF